MSDRELRIKEAAARLYGYVRRPRKPLDCTRHRPLDGPCVCQLCDLDLLVAAASDDKDLDGTDFAHPAWWRGEQLGGAMIVRVLTEVLDTGEHVGVFSNPALEALACRINGDQHDARNQAQQFQRETNRTSELTKMLRRVLALQPDIQALLDEPINIP